MFVSTAASKIAMAACVYIGSPSSTNLIIAKSKLPTLKAVTTIPKLEMNALTLGARLTHFTYSSLRASSNVHQMLFFSDSEIALGWIKAPPDRKAAGVLVANRLEEIRRIVKDLHTQGLQCLFGHIPTAGNPADFGTRVFDQANCGGKVHNSFKEISQEHQNISECSQSIHESPVKTRIPYSILWLHHSR
ncbi:unnamed protein product [Heligmosomoides polygyrus]|uniref:RNase H domain-containing protein n=1 Tax=Heligmosomoides polygyrus TaxID=6339 RepID=A0A183G9Y3_HELPZ|nr:unnamed protein product [Heligmosomoides polygyrus]